MFIKARPNKYLGVKAIWQHIAGGRNENNMLIFNKCNMNIRDFVFCVRGPSDHCHDQISLLKLVNI